MGILLRRRASKSSGSAPTVMDLYRIGRGWIPRVLFSKPGTRELIWAAAIVWQRVGRRVDELYRQGIISSATGVYLKQHLRDVGSVLQSGEQVDAARTRARTIAQAVSPPAVLGLANAMLAAAGVSGTATLVELRAAKAWTTIDTNGFHTAFCGHGYRVGPQRPPGYIIVVLPYGTPAGVVEGIRAGVQKIRAAGYPQLIEVRTSP